MSKRIRRDNASYIQSAITLSKFVPSLRKYKRRKRLTPWEKAAIARRENELKWARNLRPLTASQARKLKDELYAPEITIKTGPHKGEKRVVHGIQAIVLDNTSSHAEIHHIMKDLFITSNGRLWLYWKLNRFRKSDMIKAGHTAFTEVRQAFPLEQIAQLAERAFARMKTKEVYLWTVNGRVGEGFESLGAFMKWVQENWAGYQEPEAWVRGIAIRM